MKTPLLFCLLLILGGKVSAQKIDSIYFHLYTDSLKKGFYNYINVDGKTSDGQWWPLSDKEIQFVVTDSALSFEHNDLFIDSAYAKETVTVKAILKANPKVWREVTIYIRKRGFDEELPSNEEVIRECTKPKKSRKQ